MQKRYASSTDVARLAGVSQSTVSRTFRGDARVSAEAREKVMEAARALDYRPSLLPRIMLTQRSYLVALVVGGLHNPFYARVLERFTEALQKLNYQVMLAHVDSYEALDAVVPRLAGYRVDAVISALSVLTDAAAEQFTEMGIPVISFNTHLRRDGLFTISCDNAAAGREAARHLIAQGARRLAYLGGPGHNPADIDRRRGFVEAARAQGFAPQVSNDEFSFAGGARQALRVFAGASPPDGLFCGDDLIAIGAIDALWRNPGLAPADPLRIIGFDDIPQAAWAPYDLTSIRQDEEAMIDRAVSILERLYDGAADTVSDEVLIPGQMTLRSSSGAGVRLPPGPDRA